MPTFFCGNLSSSFFVGFNVHLHIFKFVFDDNLYGTFVHKHIIKIVDEYTLFIFEL